MNGFTLLSSVADADVSTIFGEGLTAIQGSAMGFVGKALPAALIIAGVFIAVKIGMKIYKAVAK